MAAVLPTTLTMAAVLPTTLTMAAVLPTTLTLQWTVLVMSRQLRLGMILGIYPCNARGWSSLGGGVQGCHTTSDT